MAKSRRYAPLLALIAALPMLAFASWRGYLLATEGGMLLMGQLLYWICPLLILSNAILLYRGAKRNPPSPTPLLFAAIAAGAIAWIGCHTFEPAARVQWDESDLYSTSVSMLFHHSALAPTMALPAEGGPKPIFFSLSRRPPLYPFLVSVIHATRGITRDNPIQTNFLFAWLLLTLLIYFVREKFGWPAGLSAALLLASTPLLFWVATSGEMDLLSLLMVTCVVITALCFWQAPAAEQFLQVIAVGALAAYSRYETSIIFLLIWLLCLWRARGGGIPWWPLLSASCLLPAALLPIALLLSGPSLSFVGAGGAPVISGAHFLTNTPVFIRAFFGATAGVYNWPLNWLGAAAVFTAGRRSPAVHLAGVAVVVCLSLALLWFEGSAVRLESARLYLIPAASLALAPLLWRKSHTRFGLAAALLVFCFTTGLKWHTKLLPESLDALAGERILAFANSAPSQSLFIFDPPAFLVSAGKAAVSAEFFAREGSHLNAQMGSIYWIRTGVEIHSESADQVQAELTSRFAPREVARIPLWPTPTIVYQLQR